MKKLVVLCTILATTGVLAKPIEIDLTPERDAYEARARPRTIGLMLLGGSLVGYIGTGTAFGFAFDTRRLLLAQQLPVDLAQRQELITGGNTANVVGATLLGVGIVLTALAIYFFAVSF